MRTFLIVYTIMNIFSIVVTCIFAEAKNLQWVEAYVTIARKRFRHTDTMGAVLQLFKYAFITPSLLLVIVCEGLYNLLFIFQSLQRTPHTKVRRSTNL